MRFGTRGVRRWLVRITCLHQDLIRQPASDRRCPRKAEIGQHLPVSVTTEFSRKQPVHKETVSVATRIFWKRSSKPGFRVLGPEVNSSPVAAAIPVRSAAPLP